MKKRFTRKDMIYKYPTINADSFDKRRFNELLFMSKGLQKVKHEGRNEPYFDQLMGDIWSSFYKAKPRLLDKEEINSNLFFNHQLMERVLNDGTFQETHEFTKLDDLHSALSTISFAKKIFQWIENQTEINQDLSNAHKKMMEQLKKSGDNSEQFQKKMNEYFNVLEKHMESDSKEFSEMLKDSIEQTKQTKRQINELVGGIEAGKGSKDEMKQMPLRDQFVLAEYLQHNYKMRSIAEWAGRFKAIAKSKQKSISKESISRSGITVGKDIDRILPNEMLNLSNPITKNEFLKRFVEGQTLQYATKGKQTLGKGSIILCLDQSGSMDKLDEQSKGFTLALMSIAKRQKRDFALITFDNLVNIRKYPKGKITTGEMVELCENFMGGGTDFVKPLEKSLSLIKGSKYKNADIVFVTDGQAPLTPGFLKRFNDYKEKLGFSVLSLLIGNRADTRTVSAFSDKVFHSKDFIDEKAHDVFKI